MKDIGSPRLIKHVVNTPRGRAILVDINKSQAIVLLNGRHVVFAEHEVTA